MASQHLSVTPCRILGETLHPLVVHPSLVPMGGTVAVAVALAAAAAAVEPVVLAPQLAPIVFPQMPRLIQRPHQRRGCGLGGWCGPSSVPKARERGQPEYESGTLELPLVLPRLPTSPATTTCQILSLLHHAINNSIGHACTSMACPTPESTAWPLVLCCAMRQAFRRGGSLKSDLPCG